MNEEIVTFGDGRTLVGILHRAEHAAGDRPAVLLLNAGILHRVGPNRLYVNIARQLARRGFCVLRFDVWGIGDSQDQNGAQEERTFVDDTLEAIELLRARVGASRFMLMGICMGAQIALEVARREPRVESLVLMEGIYVRSSRYHVSRALDPEKWRRVLTGESEMVKKLRSRVTKRLKRVLGPPPASAAPEPSEPPPTSKGNLRLFFDENRDRNQKQTLRSLLDRGTKIMLVFRDGNEIAYNYRLRTRGDEIVALGLPAGLAVEFVRFADHTFTPLASQKLLLSSTLRWIAATHSAKELRA